MIALDTKNKSDKEKQKIEAKLHSQFEHPPHEKLLRFIKTTGIQGEDFHAILEKHNKLCEETCERYRKKNPWPVVGMKLGKEFNAVVAIRVFARGGRALTEKK